MGGALDQPVGAIEKLVRDPLQGNSAVGTAVFVNKYPMSLTHCEECLALIEEAFAAWVGKVVQPTERGVEIIIKVIIHVAIIPSGAE